HVVPWVDEEKGAPDAVPAVFAHWPRWRLRRHRCSHGKAKPEAAIFARKIELIAGDPGLRPDMIPGHQRDGLAFEIAPVVQRTAVEQHLRNARVIANRADHACPARLPAVRQDRIAQSGDWTVEAV